jgi:hypothetical protein
MSILKSRTLFLVLSLAVVVAMAQTATTKTTSTTVTTKTSAPAAKTKSTGTTSKTPQTTSKTSTSKTTVAKKAASTKKPAPKTTTSTSMKSTTTTTTGGSSNKSLTPKTQGSNTQTNPVSPAPIKTEPTIVIPKQGGQVVTPTPVTPSTPQGTNTGTQQQTNQSTGGKVVIGGGGNTTPTPSQPNTGGGKINPGGGGNNGGGSIIDNITEGDASSAIKEALMKGIQVGVDKVSVTDGYFGNAMIKIPFPSQVKQVESTMRQVGMGSVVDNAVLSMNRAAESAAKQAGPIFINSIKQMTVTDAVNIVSNQQPDAATQFLKRTTTESLVTSFKPSIKTALDKTLATKYWSDITTYYNKIPFVNPINTDLPDYVTRKAIDGLFYMVAQEEAKIRKDPAGTANDIIDKVFGKVLKK